MSRTETTTATHTSKVDVSESDDSRPVSTSDGIELAEGERDVVWYREELSDAGDSEREQGGTGDWGDEEITQVLPLQTGRRDQRITIDESDELDESNDDRESGRSEKTTDREGEREGDLETTEGEREGVGPFLGVKSGDCDRGVEERDLGLDFLTEILRLGTFDRYGPGSRIQDLLLMEPSTKADPSMKTDPPAPVTSQPLSAALAMFFGFLAVSLLLISLQFVSKLQLDYNYSICLEINIFLFFCFP